MRHYLKIVVDRALKNIQSANRSFSTLLKYADNEQPGGTNMHGMAASFPQLEVALKNTTKAIQDMQESIEKLDDYSPVMVSSFVDQALKRAIDNNQEALNAFLDMPDKTGWREWPNNKKMTRRKVELLLKTTDDTLKEIQQSLSVTPSEDRQSLNQAATDIVYALRKSLSNVRDENSINFIEEAIACFENKLYRAAVVLSWMGAVSVLYEHVVDNHLAAFNAEATRRNPKWRNAKTRDDLASRMQEADFLDVLEAISVMGKNVKQQLKQSLELRNGCGHPNSLEIRESVVAAHIETLILNVFSRFKI